MLVLEKKTKLCLFCVCMLLLKLHACVSFSFCRYGPSQQQQLRGLEESRDWLRSHSTSGLQESASNSPFSPGSSLTSPSGSRFTFSQLGRWPRPQLKAPLLKFALDWILINLMHFLSPIVFTSFQPNLGRSNQPGRRAQQQPDQSGRPL